MSMDESPWWLSSGASESGASLSSASSSPVPAAPRRVLDQGRYEVLSVLGSGAYATVSLAEHTHTRTRVAVKEALALHDHERARRTLRELKLLQHFKGHPNIVTLVDAFAVGSGEAQLEAACLVLQPMDSDLARQLSHGPLTQKQRRLFGYQLLNALKAIHSAGVIHRDIKPQNVLINSSLELRLCDFGTSRGDLSAPPSLLRMTAIEAVATPFYRAPEALLSARSSDAAPTSATHVEYDTGVDMWACGCVLAECVLREPLFPGRTSKELMTRIVQLLGPPKKDTLDLFQESSLRQLVASMADVTPLTLKVRLGGLASSGTPLAPFLSFFLSLTEVDLVQRLLAFDPRQRLSAPAALAHEYFEELHDSDEETTWAPFTESEADASAPLSLNTPVTTPPQQHSPPTSPKKAMESNNPSLNGSDRLVGPSDRLNGSERWQRQLWRELQLMRPQRTPKRNFDL